MSDNPHHDDLIEDLARSQGNTSPPDIIRNTARAEGFLWKGSPDATPVQRIAFFLFGVMFLCQAFFTVPLGAGERSFPVILFGYALGFIGLRLLYNAFRGLRKKH
jgi:hypothetical protein